MFWVGTTIQQCVGYVTAVSTRVKLLKHDTFFQVTKMNPVQQINNGSLIKLIILPTFLYFGGLYQGDVIISRGLSQYLHRFMKYEISISIASTIQCHWRGINRRSFRWFSGAFSYSLFGYYNWFYSELIFSSKSALNEQTWVFQWLGCLTRDRKGVGFVPCSIDVLCPSVRHISYCYQLLNWKISTSNNRRWR